MTPPSDRPRSSSRAWRKKTSEAVIEHLVESILAGELRPGDRIDIDKIGEELDVSRIPVREALLVMEHDGLVETQYHRAVHVAQFDAAAIREHFELYGILGGVARRKMVTRPGLDDYLARLRVILAELDTVPQADVKEWERLGQEFLAVIYEAGAGPRLRSMLGSFRYFLPYAYEMIVASANNQMIDVFRRELAALEARDGEAAAQIAEATMRRLADQFVAELKRAGILGSDDG